MPFAIVHEQPSPQSPDHHAMGRIQPYPLHLTGRRPPGRAMRGFVAMTPALNATHQGGEADGSSCPVEHGPGMLLPPLPEAGDNVKGWTHWGSFPLNQYRHPRGGGNDGSGSAGATSGSAGSSAGSASASWVVSGPYISS